jgi:hypothetical protein
MNDSFGADNAGRIRVKILTVAAGGAGASAAEARQSITGRWYYEEFGNAYSREFTAEGKCIFRKGETFVWSLPYRMVEGKAIIIMPDGLVLRHELAADGRLDIEGKFLARREGPPAAPARLPVRLAQGRWRTFTKGVRAHQGGKEFMLEVPARLEGKPYLEVPRGKLNMRMDGDITLFAFGDKINKLLEGMGFERAQGVQVVWKGAFGKRRTSDVFVKHFRRGDSLVGTKSWIMIVADR